MSTPKERQQALDETRRMLGRMEDDLLTTMAQFDLLSREVRCRIYDLLVLTTDVRCDVMEAYNNTHDTKPLCQAVTK